jgi:hypothetical protein
MADIHMLKLERIQYRCLRIALGLMQSTHVLTVEVIAGVVPLRMRFSLLSQKFLTSVYAREAHPLKQKLLTLQSLDSLKIIREFSIVKSFNISLNSSIYNLPFDALLYTPEVDDEV